MPSDTISYSDKYDDDHFEYRDGWNESPLSPLKVLVTRQETNLRLQSFNLLASQIHSSPRNQARHAAIWSGQTCPKVFIMLELALFSLSLNIFVQNFGNNSTLTWSSWRNHLMTETEWRNLGVQQSPGWIHYMFHTPEPHVLLFRREKKWYIIDIELRHQKSC